MAVKPEATVKLGLDAILVGLHANVAPEQVKLAGRDVLVAMHFYPVKKYGERDKLIGVARYAGGSTIAEIHTQEGYGFDYPQHGCLPIACSRFELTARGRLKGLTRPEQRDKETVRYTALGGAVTQMLHADGRHNVLDRRMPAAWLNMLRRMRGDDPAALFKDPALQQSLDRRLGL